MTSGQGWRKSTYSAQSDCVEVSSNPSGFIVIRDSKSFNTPELIFPLTEWTRFVNQNKMATSRIS